MSLNLSPRRKAALIILAAFLVLGSLAIYTANPLSAHSLERRLALAAEDALYAANAVGWVRMSIDGQVITLSGQAPSRAARDEAVTSVRRASWAGGAVAGGVTKVIDETRLAYEGEAVRLAADLSGARLSLTGFAPDAEAVDRITARAERLFPGRADVDLRIAPGSAAPGWDAAARLMLAELARLDYGGGRVADGRVVLTGLAANAQTLEAVRAAFDAPPAEFSAAALVRVDGGGFEARIADARTCELLISAALGTGRVGFTPGRASLSPGSEPGLRRAGRVFAACAAEPLTVAVRAEGAGEEAEALALERAEAIIDVLAGAGAGAGAGAEEARFLAESAPADAASAFQLTLPPAPAEGAPGAQAGDAAADEAETGDPDDQPDEREG